MLSPPKESDLLCQRRKNAVEGKEEKRSWIDPPEEPKTVMLTQAEIESCMQTYEVGCFFLLKNIIYVQFCNSVAMKIILFHDV